MPPTRPRLQPPPHTRHSATCASISPPCSCESSPSIRLELFSHYAAFFSSFRPFAALRTLHSAVEPVTTFVPTVPATAERFRDLE